ncbi:MAG TPA: alcohol dehydrogenase catalytic domain-containing protein [Actinomycetes bacterium]|jgi:L-iditol 2-dehydrogenase|nr:alcohol dehydrogenase catalytic domain-containing protein [Actinomycetes bacterium]
MKAALLYGPADLRIVEVAAPEPGPGEVVLQIRAAGTCGTDRKMYLRGHPALGPYPSRFGHEFAGVVGSVGEGVAGFSPGEPVFCADSAPCGACFQCRGGRPNLCEDLRYLLGGFAEQVLVPARLVTGNLHALPAGVGLEVAPLAEPLACALHAVERAGIAPGDRVAIVGGGALGLMLCALARRAGGRPIVLDPHQERLGLAERFGAEATVGAERGPADVERLKRATPGGRGADQVFEAVGRTEAWELAVDMARPGGVVNLFGGCPRDSRVPVPTDRVHYEELRLQGAYHHTPRCIAEALGLLAGGPEPWAELCGPRIGLEALEAALTGALTGAPLGKYLVVPGVQPSAFPGGGPDE